MTSVAYPHAWNTEQETISDDDLAAIFTEMQLDVFRNDPIYQAAFDHGDFGEDIMEADFDTFSDIKTYIADTIFATDNSDDTNAVSTDDSETYSDTPEYVDLSAYYDAGEWTPPKMYQEPGGILMPDILKQYNTNVAELPQMLDHYDSDYPVDLSGTTEGWPEELGLSADPGRGLSSEKRWRDNVNEVIGKGQHWKDWAEVAGVNNLNSRNDSDLIKAKFRELDGILPQQGA